MKKKKLIKKKLEDFIKDESGHITKENILKFGLGTVGALTILGSFSSNVMAGHSQHSQHANTVGGAPLNPSDPTSCIRLRHSNHSSHSNHGSY